MTTKEAQEIYRQGEKVVVAKLCELDKRIAELKGRCALDSHNSSKPPSSDGPDKPAPKSRRTRSGRKPGGQPGHPGHTLPLSANPDKVITHKVTSCPYCDVDLSAQPSTGYEKRQVVDFPHLELQFTEHRFEETPCYRCGKIISAVDEAPAGVDSAIQYGPRIMALATYLNAYQMLPFKRCAELFSELFDSSISPGTIASMVASVSKSIEPSLAAIGTALRAEDVVHFDETGASVKGAGQWIHDASSDSLTLLTIHPRRGVDGMDAAGIIGNFSGIAVHDHWKPYFSFKECRHAICNAHILRELTFAAEELGQKWAQGLKDHLGLIEKIVDEARTAGAHSLPLEVLARFKRKYMALIRQGIEENPEPIPLQGKRGRPKDTKAGNLVRRLKRFWKETLLFMYDFSVPYTNNQAERDLRMTKVKQKISGTFRSEAGGQHFCRIRSYLSTARKQGMSALLALELAIACMPFMPK